MEDRDRERPAPLIRPPELRTDEQRGASRLELFFDLAYLAVVAELATVLAKDLTLHGALVFAGLFAVTWWSWVTTTLYANRFDTNDVIYRLAKLTNTLAVIGLAAAAPEATGDEGATRFALSFLATRLLLFLLYLRAWRHVRDARTTITIYLAGIAVGAAWWGASLFVPGNFRYACWALGVLCEAAAPLVATRRGGGVPLHIEHLPDRFALFVLLILGESVTSIVTGVHDTHWSAETVAVGVLAFAAVAAVWWNYFDLGGAAGKRRLEEDGEDQESGVADAYIYGHLPLTLGLAALAVGIEDFLVHPESEVSSGARWAVHAGAVLFLAGTALVVAGTSGRLGAAWPWPIAVVPVALVIGLLELAPWVAMTLTAALLLFTVLAGMRQQRRGRIATSET